MPPQQNDRLAASTTPEDAFTTLFSEAFGLEKALLLVPQFPVEDIYGGSRFVDYALRTTDDKVAFEIDGLQWHLPDAISVEKYEDDLLRQNSLIHQGWRVFRWTDRQLARDPEEIKEQLRLFLERIPGLLAFDDFLPKQQGEVLELREHQEEALAALARLRGEGKTIALLPHAQGAGKTVTAILDARRLGGRALYVVHTRDLVTQAYDKFRELWPEASTGLFFEGVHDTDAHNLVGSVQSVAKHLSDFPPDTFAYLIVDEAHHATAETYQRVLKYFNARFILGLTATPDRADGQSVLELFRDCAHRLSLREAVERGELVPIRCVRVETNVNLSKVRYNQIQYNRRDIEETVLVPARDELIVSTYRDHVPGRKAVAFCVNVRHGEELAERFRKSGIAARSVSGRMPAEERKKYLEAFREGALRVLCACDILNEGWDCPDVEVLLMARPTLSKVIYLQQLGRGTRKAPGKESLIVFDFVDNATRYNTSLSIHRILGNPHYRPGAFVLASREAIEAEQQALAAGNPPTAVLPIGLWARDYQEIDVFNWQEVASGMLSAPELERRLGVGDGRVKRAVERGDLTPDHTLQLGERTYQYFNKDRVDEVRRFFGLPDEDADPRSRFLQFVEDRDMSASYKPVFLLALLDCLDGDGKTELARLTRTFGDFYRRRAEEGLPAEHPRVRLSRVGELDESDVREAMLQMPFEKFERRGFVRYDRDVAFVRISPVLWRLLTDADLAAVRQTCQESIDAYYERIKVA